MAYENMAEPPGHHLSRPVQRVEDLENLEVPLTDPTRDAVQEAAALASELRHDYCGTDHLLFGLLSVARNVFSGTLNAAGIEPAKLEEELRKITGNSTSSAEAGSLSVTPRTVVILEAAARYARQQGQPAIDPNHLLIAILDDCESAAVQMLAAIGVDLQMLRDSASSSNATAGLRLEQGIMQKADFRVKTR
jgi:ATP-dependent Clp protease ATP-binding subunit ClpC